MSTLPKFGSLRGSSSASLNIGGILAIGKKLDRIFNVVSHLFFVMCWQIGCLDKQNSLSCSPGQMQPMVDPQIVDRLPTVHCINIKIYNWWQMSAMNSYCFYDKTMAYVNHILLHPPYYFLCLCHNSLGLKSA